MYASTHARTHSIWIEWHKSLYNSESSENEREWVREKLKVKIESIESMKAFSTTQLYDGHNKRQMRNCVSIWVSLSSMAFCRLPILKSVDSKCAFVVVSSLTHTLNTNTNTDTPLYGSQKRSMFVLSCFSFWRIQRDEEEWCAIVPTSWCHRWNSNKTERFPFL